MTRLQLLAGASSILLGSITNPARADSAKQRCAAAFEEGQRAQMVRDLERAIVEFKSCTVSSCPAAAQRECSRLLDVAQLAIPAVQFELKFAPELSKRPVTLSVDDGEPRTYDREALHVNPGKHRFVFQCEGCATVSRRIVFAERDSKLKEVVLKPECGDAEEARTTVASSPEAPPPTCPPSAASSAAVTSSESARVAVAPTRKATAEGAVLRDTLILGSAAALAVVGGLGFVGFGLEARSAERALSDCAPYCSGARIAEVKRSYLLANASLGSGVLALGGGAIWWFGLRGSSQAPRSNAASRGQWSVELGAVSKVTRTF
jgi:hypothetical protein